ncbi:MAG: SBBP repeat-containing protein, partial [Anaerolineales bacterium]
MFAFTPRIGIVSRIVLAAVIVFNALIPTTTVVQAKQEAGSTAQANLLPMRAESRAIPTFERPEPRTAEHSDNAASPTITNNDLVKKGEKNSANYPVMFVENVGQFDPRARFQVTGSNTTIFLAENEIWFSLFESPRRNQSKFETFEQLDELEKGILNAPQKRVNLKVFFPGANPHPRLEPFDKMESKVSYLKGNDSSLLHADVPVWSGVRYIDIYPGADLELTSRNGQLTWAVVIKDEGLLLNKQNYVAQNGLRVKIAGSNGLTLSYDSFSIKTDLGDYLLPLIQLIGINDERIRGHIPRIKDDEILLIPPEETVLGPTHHSSTLPDDNRGTKVLAAPVPLSTLGSMAARSLLFQQESQSRLLYANVLGGTDYDWGEGIAVGQDGSIYVVGGTLSPDFPTQPGSYDQSYGGISDVFVVKLSPTSDVPIYATFLGGSLYDGGEGIDVDQEGVVYVSGCTQSNNFPVRNAYDSSFNGPLPEPNIYTCADGFIAKLNPAGSDLLYSSYLGDSITNWVDASTIDSNGSFYVALSSRTSPSSGEITSEVLKINADGAPPIYTHSLGSTRPGGIAVGNTGFAYVGGETLGRDVFAISLDQDGNTEYFVSFGGSADDAGRAIAVDNAGFAYITGDTYSATDFPTTVGALRRQMTGNNARDAILTKLDANGTIVYSTLFGGESGDLGFSVDVDAGGAIYISGDTSGVNFPVTFSSIKSDPDWWNNDAFAVKLVPTGTNGYSIEYGTYIGGDGDPSGPDGADEYTFDGTIDSEGNIYVTGQTESPDFVGAPGRATEDNP